jgi:hypothetical protein
MIILYPFAPKIANSNLPAGHRRIRIPYRLSVILLSAYMFYNVCEALIDIRYVSVVEVTPYLLSQSKLNMYKVFLY